MSRSPVSSRFVQSVCALFIIKPLIDLLWFTRMPYLGISLSPGHLVGGIVAIAGVTILLTRMQYRPFEHTLFLVFILSYIASMMWTTQFGGRLSVSHCGDHLCRVVDSLAFLHIGFLIGLRKRETEGIAILKSMLIGNSIAMSLNAAAILLGFEVAVDYGNANVRTNGLYYDPGVLAINAVQNTVFALYLASGTRGMRRHLLLIGMPAMSGLLIWNSVSRSGILLFGMTFAIYSGTFKRGVSKATSFATICIAIIATIVLLAPDMSVLNRRFDTEQFALEQISKEGMGELGFITPDKFSLGNLKYLGSSRGEVIARALGEVFRRPVELQMFGYFNSQSSHCDYVDILARNGFIGLTVYLLLLFCVWSKMYRCVIGVRRSVQRIVAGTAFCLITLYILYSFPFRPLAYTTNSWCMWCLVGWSLAWPASVVTRWKQPRLHPHRTLPEVSPGKLANGQSVHPRILSTT